MRAAADSKDVFLQEVNARLEEATRNGTPLGLVLTIRGRIEPVGGRKGERWRVRTGRGYVITFRPEFVVAFDGADASGDPPLRKA
jgi:hypothetical protein